MPLEQVFIEEWYEDAVGCDCSKEAHSSYWDGECWVGDDPVVSELEVVWRVGGYGLHLVSSCAIESATSVVRDEMQSMPREPRVTTTRVMNAY